MPEQADLFPGTTRVKRTRPRPEPRPIAPSTWEVREGRWQDALADVVTCDALITDPPFSRRTAEGQRGNRSDGDHLGDQKHSGITYGFMEQDDVRELIESWCPRIQRWFVMFGDHITTHWAWEILSARAGWVTAHPIPWYKPDAAPRIAGDLPSPQHETLIIARPERRMFAPELRFRPGFYFCGSRSGRVRGFVGAKPVNLLRALVRDYSEPGDLIVDPYIGSGSLALAARIEGRSSIGAERNAGTCSRARARLARGYTPPLLEEDYEPVEALP